ncbi:MAG: hypothetical protein AAGK03_03635 [Pseudomonadota bacterium]
MIGQSRLVSLFEAALNIAVGFVISFLLTLIIFPFVGVEITVGQSLRATVYFTAASLLRSYALRRLFNRWSAKHE